MLAAYRRHGIESGFRSLAWTTMATVAPDWVRAIYRRLRDKRMMLGVDLKLLHRETARQYLARKRSRRNQTERHIKRGDDQIVHARHFTTGLLPFGQEVCAEVALSMGVEPRSPFADRRMVEFAIRMPVEAKLFAPWYKFVLRKSMADILPEDVRWRRDIGGQPGGGHPGWKFYERLISEIVQSAPEIWNFAHLDAKLSRWVSTASLGRMLGEYDQRAERALGFKLFALAILAQWMTTRHQGIQLD